MSDLVLNSLSIFEVDSFISFSNVEGKLKIIWRVQEYTSFRDLMIINLCSSDKLQYYIARSKILVKKIIWLMESKFDRSSL